VEIARQWNEELEWTEKLFCSAHHSLTFSTALYQRWFGETDRKLRISDNLLLQHRCADLVPTINDIQQCTTSIILEIVTSSRLFLKGVLRLG
jgi:hypothetical protein